MSHTPYHFYVHAHLPGWRLARDGAKAWPPDAVAEDWVFMRARAGAIPMLMCGQWLMLRAIACFASAEHLRMWPQSSPTPRNRS